MAFPKPANSGVEVPLPGERPVYQQRVITEQREHSNRRDRLAEFINGPLFDKVDEGERVRLRVQLHHMNNLDLVLRDRIAHFDPPA